MSDEDKATAGAGRRESPMQRQRDPFFDFVEELFEPVGDISIRRMFGGAGVFAGRTMFALIADDEVYVKTDPDLRAALEAEGGEAFVWTRPSDGRLIDMGYVSLPPDAADEPETASEWGRRALDVALKAKRPRH
ncbi:MAG: transcriptional regulator [Gammaproteobacteria bacterium]|nr:transcriptional regulator [Gammaproteobacteria bacterium]